MRIRLGAQPAIITSGLKDRRHAVVDLSHKFIRRHCDDGEGSLPLARSIQQRCKAMDTATERAFAKLALLKPFDFCKARALTQEQQDWVQLICDRYLNGSVDERAGVHLSS